MEGTGQKNTPKKSVFESASNKAADADPFSNFGGGSSFPSSSKPTPQPKADIFKGIGTSTPNTQPKKGMALPKPGQKNAPSAFDPFDTSAPSQISKPSNSTAGTSNKVDIFGTDDPFSSNKASTSDPFSNFGASKPVQEATGINTQFINMTSGFKSLGNDVDPFADIGAEEHKAPTQNDFGGFSSSSNFGTGFGTR